MNAGSFVATSWYVIATPGTTTWSAIGAPSSNIGTRFQATGAGSGTGTAYASSTGDGSFTILESMADNGSTTAWIAFSNLFVGTAGAAANNGALADSNGGATMKWYGNTFAVASNDPTNTWRYLKQSTTDGIVTENNACYDSTQGSGTYLNWTANIIKSDYNYFQNWGTPNSTYTGTHGQGQINLLLVNPSGGDYSPSTGSPLIGAGDNNIGLVSPYSLALQPGAVFPNPATTTRVTTTDIGAYQTLNTHPPFHGFF